MNIVLRYAITVLLYPGGLFALVASWVLFWLTAWAAARRNGEQKPRFTQPIEDMLKLLNKATSLPTGAESAVRLMPLLAVVSPLLVIVLLPLPGNLAADSPSTSGDLLAVVFLLLLPMLAPIALGYVLASPYGHIAARRATPRLVVLTGLLLVSTLAVAAQRGSLSLSLLSIQQTHPSAASIILDLLAGLLFLLCLPALIPQAAAGAGGGSPELIAGPTTDLTGADLALLRLSAAAQVVAAGSLLASLFILPYVPGGLLAQLGSYLATLIVSSLFVGLVTRHDIAGYSFAR
jgi:formate hydrogenlyase subunit 4